MAEKPIQIHPGGSGLPVRELIIIWLPTVVYVGAIMFMATRPVPKFIHVQHIDKYLHALAYALLGGISFYSGTRSKVKHPFLLSFILATVVAGSDEILQSFTHGRVSSFADFLADVFGILIGNLLSWKLLRDPWQKTPT